jgi:AbrB family looped-hinge helix DNA binding protein
VLDFAAPGAYRLTFLSYFQWAVAVDNTRVSSKGQMIIPKRVREALGLKKGTELAVELLPGGGFAARPKATDLMAQVRSIAGMLKHVRKPGRTGLTDDEAVLRAVAADDARIRAYARKRRRK